MLSHQLSHYRILEKLGAGGMGEVYLAEDVKLRRKLALKILPAEFTQDQERVARFEQEARAASALNHPNIITIYEVGEDAGVHFIATEFIAGHTLRQHLRSTGIELREALEITVQIASALSAAHEAGITHRDIKPENVMIRPDGIVKVLDFGLAKLTEARRETERRRDGETGRQGTEEQDTLLLLGAQSASLPVSPSLPLPFSSPGLIMGTVLYMSPEQARGLAVDGRSDIFSLGVLLYEMLAGRAPFDGPTMSDVLAAILRSEPAPISRYVAIPAELEWSVSKALRKDCDARYQTIKGLLADLKQLKGRLDFESELARVGPTPLPQRSNEEIGEALTIDLSSKEYELLSPSGRLFSARRRLIHEEIDSLAILPLVNAGDDPGMEYLSDGITESIINSLSQLPQLRVVPRSTVFHYKGKTVDPQQAGAELGVRAVLSGRVLQVGDSLIIRTELVDVAQQAQLWGEQYRRRITDIFALQEEIAEEISHKLRLHLSPIERQKLMKRYTDNTAAYHLYLKGRYYVGKRTPDWIRKGIEHFQQAIDLDPNYALAYSGLAEAYGFLASSTGGQPPRDAYPIAKAAALKALELDDTLGEAHCSLGFFRLLYDWDYAAAEREYLRAIELSPNFSNAWDGYGFYLKATGQHEASIAACQRAQELEPLSLFLTLSLGWAYYFARRFDDALAQSRKVLEMDPNFGFAYWHQGMVYLQKQAYEKAIISFRKAINLSGSIPSFIGQLGHASARAGKHREARQMLAQLEGLAKRQYVSAYFIALIYLGLGELEPTFAWLERAYEERSGALAYVHVEPMLDLVRGDARFVRLLEKIKLAT